MKNKRLLKLKEEYGQIEVPVELHTFIQIGIDRGREEMNAKSKKRNKALKICAGFIIASTLFTGSLNVSPSFADTLKNVPVVGKVVEVLQFIEGKSGGGKITDGTDISNIGLIKEGGYESIVLNFSQGDQLQTDMGKFEVRYQENPYTMIFEIGGARRISAEENFEKILESKYVKDVYKIITLDDSLNRFVIEFEVPVKYEVKETKEPASIVISLKEDKQFVGKKMYSLRTKSYPYGETLGMLEEKLGTTNPTRILKDAEGMYFVELQLFETKKDALSRLDEISGLNYAPVFIEERFGSESPKSYYAEIESEVSNKNTTKSHVELSGKDDVLEKASLYPVSINENDKHYYGNIEILGKGINLYGEDIEAGVKYYFHYQDIKLTKLPGEASYNLRIETNNKVIIVSGVFSDFFEELEKQISNDFIYFSTSYI